MYRAELTEYGKKVKTELIKIDKNQEWLIDQIKSKLPNSYVDGSVLNKVFKGQIKNSKLIPVINEILNFHF